VDAIEALICRFPGHAKSIRTLQMQDPNFRAICEDYAEALRARQHWQKANDSAHKRAEEYDHFVTDLEEEALTALRAYECR
jgi:hypothetical protein